MIPRRPLLLLLAALMLGWLACAGYPPLGTTLLVATLLALLLAATDAVLALLTEPPEVERNARNSMSLATWTEVGLVIRNNTWRTMRMQLYDHYPATFMARGLPLDAVVEKGRTLDVSYAVRPTERGAVSFPVCDLRIASPLRLWWRRKTLPVESQSRVYPNYSTISKLLTYEVSNQLQVSGIRLSRRRGEGIEFHQLRDYREGDSQRSIDWKATARMSRLIAREYQDERDQQLVFVLDAGRRMLAKDAELSHFDHALNAMLLLSFVALRQGDSAGIMSVGESRSWLPPRKGADAINGLLNHVYDIQPTAIEIDYLAAATDLAVRQRRRSLVIFLTNIREEDSDDLRVAIELLKRRHLVIVASLRERALDETLKRPIQTFDEALLYAATNQYLDSRRESQKLLQANGVFVEDCLSDELPTAITNRYLAIKRAGIL